ncbi:peptidyl-tRNA hydrolase II [Wolfiporia cocos MD-104 SS10]|uniref:peptidyl-tRNA hydrolase n=1 Tax=Wolfiporia cocos (strain MD-104) TaxID=742152 RepID=A0A2H3JHS4_WOLCO|nr:peptidyl-tRNA hydrolase II [Wolfiporia cocos MD-104 SS10]
MTDSQNVPTAAAGAATTTGSTPQPLVMQIVVRRDLLDAEGWGVGPLMAQVAHATAAVLHETASLPDTQAYLADLKNMRKAVLQTADQASIERLSALLASGTPPIAHHLWVEQPENVPTCLALAPNRRTAGIKKALDKTGCRLWKG